MAEFVDRDAVLELLEERQKELCPVGVYRRNAVYGSDREKFDEWQDLIDAVKAIPDSDVAPVRHGRWIWNLEGMDWGIGAWCCSECKSKAETWWANDKKYIPPLCSGGHFCGNCGAEMDG